MNRATWQVAAVDGSATWWGATDLPHLQAVGMSSHYGLVAIIKPQLNGDTAQCTVKLAPPPKQ